MTMGSQINQQRDPSRNTTLLKFLLVKNLIKAYKTHGNPDERLLQDPPKGIISYRCRIVSRLQSSLQSSQGCKVGCEVAAKYPRVYIHTYIHSLQTYRRTCVRHTDIQPNKQSLYRIKAIWTHFLGVRLRIPPPPPPRPPPCSGCPQVFTDPSLSSFGYPCRSPYRSL